MGNSHLNQYKQQSVMTMTKGEILLAVYDGAIKHISLAKHAFEIKDIAARNTALQKAQLIITHLQTSLDFQYEISNNLNALYDYFLHVIVQANVKQDPSELDAVMDMLADLRDTYKEADRITRTQGGFPTPPPVPSTVTPTAPAAPTAVAPVAPTAVAPVAPTAAPPVAPAATPTAPPAAPASPMMKMGGKK